MIPNHPLANDSTWAMYYRDGLTLTDIAEKMCCTEADLTPELMAPLKYAMDGIADHCIEVIKERDGIIARYEHTMTEQNKVVESMTDLLGTINGNKAKARAKAEKEAGRRFKFARNSNYLQSVGWGLREGLWNAPTALFHDMKVPFGAALGSIILVVGGLLGWIAGRFVLIGAGFAGRVTPVKEKA